MKIQTKRPIENRLLAALPRRQLQLMLSNCERVPLVVSEILAEPDALIRHVYFPVTGFISLVLRLDDGAQMEVGIVGNEGMLGMSLTLAVRASPQQAIVQNAGEALRMSADAFRWHCRRNAALRERMSHYVYVSMKQLALTAACAHYHLVEARLARWLLMSRDRIGKNQIRLTHEFLSLMLGVRRAGVTQAALTLQVQGLIRYSRGDIIILDGAGLERRSCGCYEQEVEIYDQTLGGQPRAGAQRN